MAKWSDDVYACRGHLLGDLIITKCQLLQVLPTTILICRLGYKKVQLTRGVNKNNTWPCMAEQCVLADWLADLMTKSSLKTTITWLSAETDRYGERKFPCLQLLRDCQPIVSPLLWAELTSNWQQENPEKVIPDYWQTRQRQKDYWLGQLSTLM